jgi:hypothetical protein
MYQEEVLRKSRGTKEVPRKGRPEIELEYLNSNSTVRSNLF